MTPENKFNPQETRTPDGEPSELTLREQLELTPTKRLYYELDKAKNLYESLVVQHRGDTEKVHKYHAMQTDMVNMKVNYFLGTFFAASGGFIMAVFPKAIYPNYFMLGAAVTVVGASLAFCTEILVRVFRKIFCFPK